MGNLHCSQETLPALDAANEAKLASDGVYDLEVAKYVGVNAGYFVRPWLANKRVSSQKDALSRGEGNTIRIKGFEVKYEALGLEIETLFVPQSFAIDPESSYGQKIDIMPLSIRNQILEYWAKNAYADVDNARTYFHVDANGGTADCTEYTAADDCNGYACVVNNPESVDDAGKCMPMCTVETGCASNCFVDSDGKHQCYGPHALPENWCDTGAGDIGFCRPTCWDTGYCPPVTLPDGTVALEYDCVDGYCYPKGTQVNPHKGENLIVTIKAIAESSNGDDFTSNSYIFNLRVCKGCLLSFDGSECCLDTQQLMEYLEESQGFECNFDDLAQDYQVDCSWFTDCAKYLCDEFSCN